jgi:hypothetical protein
MACLLFAVARRINTTVANTWTSAVDESTSKTAGRASAAIATTTSEHFIDKLIVYLTRLEKKYYTSESSTLVQQAY